MPFKDPNALKAFSKSYYSDNKTAIQEYRRQYYINNKEKLYATKKNWKKNNKEKVAEYMKQYRIDNPVSAEERAEWRRARCRDHPKKIILRGCKSRAKAYGLEFNLDESDIVIPEVCPILGIPLFFNEEGERGFPNTPSPDRWDNTKGYIKGNVRIISLKANEYKSDMTKEILQKLLDYVSDPSR